MHYLLGYDLGSSAVKASIVEAATGKAVASAASPDQEMEISSPFPDWAEQHPENWWKNTIIATHRVLRISGLSPQKIAGIGIAYQMHGLVLVDKAKNVLRPSIIWCDSRAVEIGNRAFLKLGEMYCTERLLNSPANFTASKLSWVLKNEPDIYARIYKAMLPGDYLAMRLTGEILTTIPGLSEGIFWDFQKKDFAERLLDYYQIDKRLLPDLIGTFEIQGRLTNEAAVQLGLPQGTPVSYRAGDQLNNAFSLNVLHPGETAATAGTSGVIYSVTDKPVADALSRVNTFAHVNYSPDLLRLGVLLCINGTGSMNSWLRKAFHLSGVLPDYKDMNRLAAETPVGADQLIVLPFGNGAERVLQNKSIGAGIYGLNFNRHFIGHLCRAVQEGIAFALGYGFEVLCDLGIHSNIIRAGNANMFLSDVFCEAFTNVTGVCLSLYNTDGAQGAARGAGVGLGYFSGPEEACKNLEQIRIFTPKAGLEEKYNEAFELWKSKLNQQLNKTNT